MEQILIVEDDTDINNMMASALTKAGYECKQSFSGTEAMLYLNKEKFSVIILDLMLPGKSGNSIVEEIKPYLDTSIIVVSAKDELDTKVNLLFSGADDYITKPFRPLELIARVKAQLRRYKKYSPVQTKNYSAPILVYKKLTLNTQTYECELNGTPIPLTPTEFSILRILLEKQGTVVSLEDLFHMVWKDEYYSKNSSTITVHVRHLREKLQDIAEKPQYIKTVWGVGYKI